MRRLRVWKPLNSVSVFMSRFYEQLQDFFSPILLVNYIISSLLICMVGLQIVAVNIRMMRINNNKNKNLNKRFQVKLTIADFLKLVVYIVSALSQLFILCWKGDQLNELVSTVFPLRIGERPVTSTEVP